MPVRFFSEPGSYTDILLFFLKLLYQEFWWRGRHGATIPLFFHNLYRELWRREHCDEDTVRRKIYREMEGEFPDYERTSDSMDIGDSVPNAPFRQKILDLSWIQSASTLQFGSRMLVRQEYEEAMSNLEQNDRNVVLSGQEGIGKTVFLLYALVERLLKRQPTIYANNPHSYFLFRESGVYMFEATDIDKGCVGIEVSESHGGRVPGGDFDFTTEEGWLLFDSNCAQKKPPKLPWKVILASSPASWRYREWAKHENARMYFMKAWDWQEICAAASLQRQIRGQDELWSMYSRFGPSARAVFKSSHKRRFPEVTSALRQVRDASQLFPVVDQWNESIGDALLVLEPLSTRRMAVGRISTPYIMALAVDSAQAVMGARMREKYLSFLCSTTFRSTAGVIFEMFAHRVLGSRQWPRTLNLKPLPSATDAPAVPIDLTMRFPPIVFEDTQFRHDIKERTYYHPFQSDFAGVSAFTIVDRTLVYLQFTVSHQHPVAIKGLRLVRKLVPAELWSRCMVVFVVPPETVPSFERQPFTPPANQPQWLEDMPQFVMPLSADGLFPR